tara:strand:+ start:129 stop:716 length:588 start_codon:yes stop_codon:yes gene_type:complete
MKNILILYYSQSGATLQMANYISQGVEQSGLGAKLRTVPEVSPISEQTEPNIPEKGAIYVTKDDIKNCDGIIIGSPTRFGNMAAPLKYFLDTTSDLWFKGSLINKPAGFFTSTSSMHGGQESTLISMMFPLLHHGAIIVGSPYSETALQRTTTGGTPYGPSHYAGLDSKLPISKEEIELCKALGLRIGKLAAQLN